MIEPLQDYVVLKETKTKLTETSIIITENADIPYSIKGEIVALGALVTMPLKLGDFVLFKRHLFELITHNKEEYLVGRQEAIYAKLS